MLTPREPWFDNDVAVAWHDARAIAEAAALLGELPGAAVVVEGYADAVAPDEAADDDTATADDRDVACARPDVVRDPDRPRH